MDSLSRISIVDQAEAALRERLAAGAWTGHIPGSRQLSDDLGVSPQTVREALARLVSAGLLAVDGPKRRFRIARAAPEDPGPSSREVRRVLCISEQPLDQMPHIGLEFLAQLRINYPRWDLRHRWLDFDLARNTLKRWDKVVANDRPHHLVVMDGRPHIARWLVDRGFSSVFLGGDPGGHAVPRVGLNASLMVQECLDRFVGLGHRHICCPVFGVSELLALNLRARCKAVLEAAGYPFVPNYHVPVVSRSEPDVVFNTISRVNAIRPPTAYIFLDYGEFLTSQCFLSDRGLAIPRDVSVILLGGAGSLKWYRPALTHFTFPVAKAARTVGRWLQDGPPTPSAMQVLPAHLVPGGSVGPPPPEG